MRINWINAVFATIISALLAWWLWSMGIGELQQWLLTIFGGLMIEIGFIGGMGLSYRHVRSGAQVKIVMIGLAVITFVASVVYSFFTFSAISYCVPMGLLFMFSLLLGTRIYKSEM